MDFRSLNCYSLCVYSLLKSIKQFRSSSKEVFVALKIPENKKHEQKKSCVFTTRIFNWKKRIWWNFATSDFPSENTSLISHTKNMVLPSVAMNWNCFNDAWKFCGTFLSTNYYVNWIVTRKNTNKLPVRHFSWCYLKL